MEQESNSAKISCFRGCGIARRAANTDQRLLGDRMTIEERLIATGGRPSGFDYLRLGLALLVVVTHSIATSYGEAVTFQVWATPLGPIFRCILPLFFALSGFLVAGSLERCKTVGGFLGLRIIRIYPALVVEVILSAFILGPIMTTLALGDYFTHPLFLSYLWNIIGHVHFYLPSVFEGNPYPPLVNAQLWTVPYELACYVAIAALAILGRKRLKLVVLLGTIALIALGLAVQIYKHGLDLPEYRATFPGVFLVFSFLAGINIYLYRDAIPFTKTAFALALAAMLLCAWRTDVGAFVIALPAAYVAAYVGLTNAPRIGLLKGADYSYGIFLYHFAIQQTLVALIPLAHEWYWNLALTLPVTAAFAALSWHAVEKPALGLRKLVFHLEARGVDLIKGARARV